jgi:hypothetical protein
MAIFDEPSRQPLPTTPELEDHSAAVIKGTLASIPVIGNVLAEELGLVLAPPLSRRRDEWFADLARRLHDLEGRVAGFKFDDLANNDQFVSATLQATQAALRTRDEIKLEALRSAVLHAALGSEPQGDRRDVFLSLVDFLQPVHLRLLKILAGLELTDKSTLSNVLGLVREADAGLRDLGDEGTTLVLQDLNSRSLIQMNDIVINNSSPFALTEGRAITLWGRAFLSFITMPQEVTR